MKLTLPLLRSLSTLVYHWAAQRRLQRSLVVLIISLNLGMACPAVTAKVRKRPVKPIAVKATVKTIHAEAIETKEESENIRVAIEIEGAGFGESLSDVAVTLVNTVSGDRTIADVTIAKANLIAAAAEVPRGERGSSRWLVELEIKGKAIDTGNERFTLAALKPAAAKPRNIEVHFKEYDNPSEPTSHQLLLTPKDDDFSTDPSKMSVQILPPGSSKVTIEPTLSPQKMLVTYNAPEGFAVSEVLVTSSDGRSLVPSQSTRPKQPASDKMKINRVDILALQRRDGFGRIRISGEGFGQHDAPPYNADLELLCDPEYRTYHVDERDDTHSKKVSSDTDLNELPLATLCKNLDNKLLASVQTQDQSAATSATPEPQRPVGSSTQATEPSAEQQNQKFFAIKTWRQNLEKSLNVSLIPRNPDFRVERTLITYASDKVIDVYFEFSHWEGVSEPFRLDGVSVSATKEEPINSSTSAEESSHHSTAGDSAPETNKVTYLASHDIGPPRDTNLEYRYTVLDPKDASHLFGSGVGENFYAIQLSLVNKGDKKVIVPLSSIQAEIEWEYYPGDEENDIYYDEGPATLSPMTLAGISSYFDLFQKTKGRKARLFNVLDGIVTLSASLVPVFGRNIERPNSILSGGFIPGLKKSLGDMSSQQLQNLTSLSWDSLEEIPAGGGKEKFVYIQRSGQTFSTDPVIKKEIKSIAGIEVSGFVVKDSRPATAVPRQ